MSEKVLLVDGHSLFHRAFHALPPLSTSTGQATNAVYGFLQMVMLLLEQEKPDYATVALDMPGPTFREERYEQYKANRPSMDEELASQLPWLAKTVRALGMGQVQAQGYEADDVIGTLARVARAEGKQVLIVTGDKDLLQLVAPGVEVVTTIRGIKQTKRYDESAVEEEYGLEPRQLVDLKALAGDKSDNIPGVPGIGEKTALSLLSEWGTLEKVLGSIESIEPARVAAKLRDNRETAEVSKELATIRTDVPVGEALADLRWSGVVASELRELASELEFASLLDRLPADSGTAARLKVEILKDDAGAEALTKQAREEGFLCVAPVIQDGRLAALCVATAEEEARGLPLGGEATGEQSLFSGRGSQAYSGLGKLREVLEDESVGKRCANLKELARRLTEFGVELRGYEFDPEVASYLLMPNRRDHSMATLVQEHLGHGLPDGESAEEGEITAGQRRAGAEAVATRRLYEPLRTHLAQAGLLGLFDELEMPLVKVLADMEAAGVAVDLERLKEVGSQLEGMTGELAGRIHKLAGCEFNIGSTQQLAEVLFERLKLPKGRRTKTGWSTSAEVLSELAAEHEIVRLVLEYREYSKLKSTYVDSLSKLVDKDSGRVHTTFEQTVAATGRLSSRNPNLQNIPNRTEWGREIRSCFVAGARDRVLISADYSQIELRILAHVSQDPQLVSAFRAGEDIHTRTAAMIFGVAPEQVTKEMRDRAKTVNFAVIYGMGATALAQQLGIERGEAAEFIERYFARLPGVRKYTEAIVQAAREQGFVSTLMGRKRPIPEIASSNPGAQAYAERAAVNTPIQGSAADIIKVAMLQLAPRMQEVCAGAHLLLQVHDELVWEAPADQTGKVAALAKEVMEGAFELDVPLTVDVAVGVNWRDMQKIEL